MALKTSLKTTLRHALHSVGYEVVKYTDSGSGEYESIFPNATYAPWQTDISFRDTYERIRSHTLVDKYRCYELWSLVAQTASLSGALIEVGVWRGGTGALIAKRARASSIAEPVYLCDTFAGVVKASEKDTRYRGGEHADTAKGVVESLLRSCDLTNAICLQGIFPEQTSHLIQGRQLRFCHIDVDVYQSAAEIEDWIWSRLCLGGIVVYDDYGFEGCNGITAFVNEQVSKPDRIVLYNVNGHAVVIKIK